MTFGFSFGSGGGSGSSAFPTTPTILVNGKKRNSATVGDALTVFYPPFGLTAPTQQALRDGTSISGATSYLYTIAGPDAGHPISFTGTGLDGAAYTTSTVAVPDVFSLTELAGEPVITTSQTGALTVTLSGTTYTTDSSGASLTVAGVESAGAVNLVKPTISGNTAQGTALTLTAGLWIYAGDGLDDPLFEVLRDGTAIENATLTYTVGPLDQATSLVLRETFGGVTVDSAPLAIPAPSLATDAGAIMWYAPENITFDGSNVVTAWPNNIAGSNADYTMTTPHPDTTAPTWDAAANGVKSNGSQTLRSTVGRSHFLSALRTQDVTRTVFTAFTPGDVVGTQSQTLFGTGSAHATNNTFQLGYKNSGDGDVDFAAYARKFATAFGSSVVESIGTLPVAKMLLELQISHFEANLYVNGTLRYTGAVSDRLNFPDTTAAVSDLFANTAPGPVADKKGSGIIHEIFVTASTNNAAYFRNELLTKHGISA